MGKSLGKKESYAWKLDSFHPMFCTPNKPSLALKVSPTVRFTLGPIF